MAARSAPARREEDLGIVTLSIGRLGTHPYRDNERKHEVHMPGQAAQSFRLQMPSEARHDYVQIRSATGKIVGPERITGRDFPQGWPDVVVPGDKCTIHFHSDGSNVDWGWKCSVEATFAGQKPRRLRHVYAPTLTPVLAFDGAFADGPLGAVQLLETFGLTPVSERLSEDLMTCQLSSDPAEPQTFWGVQLEKGAYFWELNVNAASATAGVSLADGSRVVFDVSGESKQQSGSAVGLLFEPSGGEEKTNRLSLMQGGTKQQTQDVSDAFPLVPLYELASMGSIQVTHAVSEHALPRWFRVTQSVRHRSEPRFRLQ